MATPVAMKGNRKVVPAAEWLAARKELLRKEKEFSRQRDELAALRRQLPWQRVTKEYVFEGPQGREKLGDLFDGRAQLAVYHFMLGPGWKEGCPSCSFVADGFDGAAVHLAQRDTTLVAVSRATLPEIETFKKRMGWQFKWVSSNASDFNFDYGVSFTNETLAGGKAVYNYAPAGERFAGEERPGASMFYREGGEIFHTYSTYARGLDMLLSAYNWLDMTPMGRHEEGLSNGMEWVRHHDRYPAR